jgi:hypothetical protein
MIDCRQYRRGVSLPASPPFSNGRPAELSLLAHRQSGRARACQQRRSRSAISARLTMPRNIASSFSKREKRPRDAQTRKRWAPRTHTPFWRESPSVAKTVSSACQQASPSSAGALGFAQWLHGTGYRQRQCGLSPLERNPILQFPHESGVPSSNWRTTLCRRSARASRSSQYEGRVNDAPLEDGPAATAGRTFLSPAITTSFSRKPPIAGH